MSHAIDTADGEEILVGTRVKLDASYDSPAVIRTGTVESLGDFDGDVDEDGRGFDIYPSVTVRFDSGECEEFETYDWQVVPFTNELDGPGSVEGLIRLDA